MHPLMPVRRGAGFTLVEAMIGLAIVGIALAIGIPATGNWMRANKVKGAGEFYAEGFRLARTEAIKHKSASRIVLTTNPVSGQLDWQVDICFPTSAAPCWPVAVSRSPRCRPPPPLATGKAPLVSSRCFAVRKPCPARRR